MNNHLEKAKEILISGNYTCVLFDGNDMLCSQKRGVKPLLEFLESGSDLSHFVAADRVVGAGAAHIYVLLGIKHIWANVISNSAKDILKANGIQMLFNKEVSHIINRTGDGVCPIEQCVKGIENSNLALEKIKTRLKELS